MSDAHGAQARGQPVTTSDVLTLQVGDAQLAGWQRVKVTRSMDSIPASFDLEVTERYPSTPDIDIRPGQPCTVRIGADLVLTGYVEQYGASITPALHSIRVSGRSKSCDLVDCSAFLGSDEHPSMQVQGATALAISQRLAEKYGVTITSLAGDGASVPQFNINIGETVWDVVNRMMRVSGFVAYDMPDGSLVFAQAGSEEMASGFALGQNIEEASIAYSMDKRFKEYEGFFLSVMQVGVQGNLNDPQSGPIAIDYNVPRFRKRFVVSEQMSDGKSLAGQRAQWECNRNYGRSQELTLVCDSWRDAQGKLWAPNHQAPISARALKLDAPNPPWIIGGVTYLRDENGQHAEITMMPREAFAPEPAPLNPIPPFVQDIEGNNPTREGSPV